MSKYQALVDWLSFTLPFSPAGEGATLERHEQAVYNSLARGLSKWWANVITVGGAFMMRGRAPYTMGWQNKSIGVTVWAAEATAHMTVEFSGQGLDWLRKEEDLVPLLNLVAGRLTRIDIAVDIECSVSPKQFADNREPGRFKSAAEMSSASGQTCYVGSMKSERYARVYRYAKPHPRAHLLRVEHVFRREQAQAVGHALLHFGLDNVAQSAIVVFGWRHPVTPLAGAPASLISAPRPEREGGKTLFWLLTQVAPAFQRLVTDGTISDPETFLRDYFLPAVGDDAPD